MKDFKYNAGDELAERITGFSGTVTGRADYITGCNQYLLQPPCNKETGAFVESIWFDEDRLFVLEAEATTLEIDDTHPGADKPAPIK